MFEYFPGNYVWSLTVVAALNSGGLIDEVDRACLPLREIATQGSDPGTGEFLRAWTVVVDDLEAQAAADEKAGHARTAGQKYRRATNYLLHAERMQRGHAPERMAVYQRCLDLLAKSIALADPATTRVEVPYEGTSLPAYFRDASPGGSGTGGGGGRTVPCIILWNGLDSSKEHMYLSGFADELAARGISTLMVDCPGSGEALRLRGLTARIDTEAWAAACVDYLLTRGDVDPVRIGLAGWSLGGYYAPRAAAFERRLALVVAWGANHDWGAVQRRRLERARRDQMHLALAQRERVKDEDSMFRAGIADVEKLLVGAVERMHSFATALRSAAVDDLGLLPALRSYLKDYAERTGLLVRFERSARDAPLNPEQETALFRIAQESLANVVKHAQATEVVVTIGFTKDKIQLQIKDNGKGFAAKHQRAATGKNRLGLLGMQERVRLVNGRCFVKSGIGHGTTVLVEIPLAGESRPLSTDTLPLTRNEGSQAC